LHQHQVLKEIDRNQHSTSKKREGADSHRRGDRYGAERKAYPTEGGHKKKEKRAVVTVQGENKQIGGCKNLNCSSDEELLTHML